MESNLGVSIVPSSLMHGFSAKVKFIELKNTPDRAQLLMGWNKNNNNPALLIFLKTVEEFLNITENFKDSPVKSYVNAPGKKNKK